jgi:hypothetical protein
MKLHFSLSTIRMLIGTAALAFFANPLAAQSPANPNWQDLKQSGANYNDVKAAFLQQYESRLQRAMRELTKEVGRPERKSDKFERELEGIVQFKRWSEFVEPRVAESNGDLSVINEGNVRALAQQANMLQSRAATWQLVGPRNTATNGGNGRVNGIKVHPTNSNILFASTPAGGLWKSINGGTSWTAITDAIAVLGATDVAFDPTNPDIMYLATGDGDAADTRSTGIYKSTDGGTTWVATGLNFTLSQGTTLSKILVHPTNNQILLTAGNTGIRRSTDAGATWTTVSTASIKDLEWKPNNPSVVYAGGYSGSAGVWRSMDGGVTWTKLTATPLPATGTQRVAIGVSPHDPEYVYALFAKTTTYSFQGMYRSIDGGTTWTQQATAPNMLGWISTGSDTDGQGWYDLAIAVSPTDKNMVMIGGVNIWKSTDGGVNWACKAHWSGSGAPYVHADQHDFTFSGSTFYAANDGGVFKSADSGTTWTNISSTLSNAQMYGLGLSSGNANLILSGHQDNGTNLTSNGTTWAQVLGGDGMLCFIDRTNDSRMFASIYNGALYRSTNGGNSFGSLTTITNGGWVTPWLQDPVAPATIYAAGSEINKSTDYGTNWTAISSFGGTTSFKAMDVAKTNPLCIIATTGTSVRKTINGGTSWTTLTGLPTSGILTVHFNVNDANKIYVGVASYQGSSVWYSSDGGTTWVNWGTGLPSVPVSCFVTQLGTDGSMYCGTDIGVYYRNNTSTGWTAFTQGMPGIPVRDLEIYYPTQKLRAATYGRGIWESNLEVAVSGYSILASANPVTGGTITGTGFFTSGQSVTLTATPNTGWTFVNWTENGTAVSTNATLTFNATANRTLQANFTGGPLPACGNTTLTNCSGTITDGSGALNYENDLSCTWLIRPTTPPAALVLNFTAFATELDYDFVKVYDGTSANGVLLGSFSGTTLPPRLVATSGAMFIQFTSDAGVVDAGWAATYSCSSGTSYNLTLNANPVAGGSVLGAGSYFSGDSVTVSAIANANYLFTNWTDSLTGAVVSNNAIYGFRMTAARKLIANFRVSGCVGLTTYTNCSGTVEDGSGANSYNNNLNCTWLIQPTTPPAALTLNFTSFSTESGYDSVKVYDGTSANGRLLGGFSGANLPPRLLGTSGALFIQFTSDANTVSTGWSADYACTNATLYAVTLNANPVAGGTVTGARSYLLGDSATITATANVNYRFLNWTDSTGNIVSTNAIYGFRITGNRRLIANFVVDGCNGLTTYTTCNGTVSDGSAGNYINNLSCTWLIQPSPAATRITLHFTAFATEANYDSVAVYDGTSATGRFLGKFSGATLPADLIATSSAMFLRFTTDASNVYAGWSADWTCANSNPTYTLTLNANPVAGGTVSGGGSYTSGQSVRALARPATGWNFVNWTENGNIVSSDTAFSFVLTGYRTLTANFVQTQQLTMNTTSFPLACGTTSGSGSYAIGQSVTLTATAASQFLFEKWTENNITVSTNRIYTFTASANRTLIAVFKGILSSDWDVTPTSENHTLVVPLNANVQLGNGSLQNGDYLGVFYTDSNRLKCAGRQVWNGASTSVTGYGNDLGVGKNGFALNERFTWRVFRPSTRMQYDVDPAYLPIAGIYTHQGTYARDGISGLAGLTAQVGDTLHLDQGWNMVGIYVHPADSALANMLAPITNQLILMKTVDGRTYIPSTGINTIQNWNVKEGYRIKMAQAADVVLYGRRIDPMTIQIPFTAGWSIIPYVRMNPMVFPSVFTGNAAQIDLAKDNLGQTWIPSLSVNNIGNALVNQAYKVKFNASGVLSQPANGRGDSPIENPSSARYFEVSKQPTGEDATIILTQSVFKDVLQIGDEVGVFNATGLLCGSVIWRGDNTAIAVKGDDAFTAPQEGMKTGDNYQLHVKRQGFDLPIRLNATFENASQAHYAADNISRLTKASLPSMPELPFAEKAFAYPNPVGTELTIQLESDDANAMIILYDVMGNILQLNTEQRIVGKTQIWKFDTSNLANGAYLYTVKTVNKTHNGTYMIQH